MVDSQPEFEQFPANKKECVGRVSQIVDGSGNPGASIRRRKSRGRRAKNDRATPDRATPGKATPDEATPDEAPIVGLFSGVKDSSRVAARCGRCPWCLCAPSPSQ